MSLFDSLINETETKFNLGGKGGTLLSALLALVTNKSRGGFAGFLERFNRAGLGDTASSWVKDSANMPISNEQLESVLAHSELENIANQVGTNYETATSAAAFMMPQVVDRLTPNGVLPDENDLLSSTGTYSTNVGGTVSETARFAGATVAGTIDRIGTAATDVIDAGRETVSDGVNIIGDRVDVSNNTGIVGDRTDRSVASVYDDNDDSPLKWLLPLLLFGLLLILGYSFCRKSPTPTAANANANTNSVIVNANK
jgi:uncharacterized protein YidB (DUF937 family)